MFKSIKSCIHYRTIYNITPKHIFHNDIIKCNYINCLYTDYTKLVEEDIVDYSETDCVYVCENCGLLLKE